jgi:hypothetical protein
VNWAFRDLSPLSAPGRNSLKSQRSPIAVYYIYRSQANGFDGKILLGVLFLNFTVRPASGLRESLQIMELSPLQIAGLGKSLGFSPSAVALIHT